MSTTGNTRIAPAGGKLGVLIPGIGAVSTTFMAGVEAVKRGLGQPIGSLTQLGTVRHKMATQAYLDEPVAQVEAFDLWVLKPISIRIP